MLRLLHTADVHLGARHADLGEQAAAQRERQFAAFKAAVDLAIAEKVDVFLDRRRPVRLQHPAAPLGRAGRRGARGASSQAKIRTVIIPGTHDVYDRASIYRVHDLAALAGITPGRRPRHGPHAGPARPSTSPTLRRRRPRPRSSRRSAPRTARSATSTSNRDGRPRRRGTSAMVHGALAIPDRTDRDEVVFTPRGDRRERPRLPRARPLALDPAGQGRRRRPTPTPARRSPSRSTRTAPARSSLVALDDAGRRRRASRSRRRTVGRTTFEQLDVDAARARRPAGPDRAALGEGRPRPRPRRPPDRRPPGRARRRPGRGRGAAQGLASCGSASATVDAGPDRGRPALGRHDPRRLHPRTSRAGSPSSRPTASDADDARGGRSSATSSAWAGCCWPATRSRL